MILIFALICEVSTGAVFSQAHAQTQIQTQADATTTASMNAPDAAYDRAMQIFSAQLIPATANFANSVTTRGKFCPVKNEKQKADSPEVQILSCTRESASETDKLPHTVFVYDANLVIKFCEDNDNPFLGALPGGNDLGYTHGFCASIMKQIKSLGVRVKGEVTSKLFTKDIQGWDTSGNTAALDLVNSGKADRVQDVSDYSKYPVQLEDRTRVDLSVEKDFGNMREFYARGLLGVDIVRVNPGRLNLGQEVQTGWHSMLKHFGTVQYHYVPANGESLPVKVVQQDGVRIAQYTSGFTPSPYLQHLAALDWIVGGDVGTQKQVFSGCTAKAEMGGILVTNGKNFIGPNSYVHVLGNLNPTVFKNKSGDPRLKLLIESEARYFPGSDQVDSQHFGAVETFGAELIHPVGKDKTNTLSVFVNYGVNKGRNFEQAMNDHDAIVTIGLIWTKKSKKKKE